MIGECLDSLRFDGDVIKTDETIRTLAQKWQPAKRTHSDERHAKAVDTDMIITPCVVRCFWPFSKIKCKRSCCPVLNIRCRKCKQYKEMFLKTLKSFRRISAIDSDLSECFLSHS